MRFNSEILEPPYQLIMNKSGESNALWICKKMGIQEDVLKKASFYMISKDYNIACISKDSIRQRAKEKIANKIEEKLLSKGDKVFLTEYQDYGIVYEPVDKSYHAKVLYKGEIIAVHQRQLQLAISSKELYPGGYNVESLFTDFKERKLDILGIMILGLSTVVGGGMIRDIILGNTPPAMFINPVYCIVASMTVVIVILTYRYHEKLADSSKYRYMTHILNVSDAIGLGFFTVVRADVSM